MSHSALPSVIAGPPKNSVLWLFTGVMVLIFAAAGGFALSGAATAVSAKVGIREETIAAIAVATLLAGFTVTLVATLRDLAKLVRRGERFLPRRWVVGSIVVMFVAGPFWSLCVVHIQEPISGSDSVRTLFDNVLYVLVGALTVPLAAGVPMILTRLRRQASPRCGPPK